MNSMVRSLVLYGTEAASWLRRQMIGFKEQGIPVFILMDANTYRFCLPVLAGYLPLKDQHITNIILPAGETSKNMDSCHQVWQELITKQAGRDAVLINLGGGMITDLGGFAASVYKRGVRFIHIPTSLLSMVDAAFGGKTGIGYQGIKNTLGTFSPPEAVLIFDEFLNTLPKREMLSGLAEVIKYGYINDPEILDMADIDWLQPIDKWQVISKCIHAKLSVVEADPMENGRRKLLNFGHTVGHAIESLSHAKAAGLLHGEAIALGMYCALWLSVEKCKLSPGVLDRYTRWYLKHFKPYFFDDEDYPELFRLMYQDKKNIGGGFRFVLIKSPGDAYFDIVVGESQIAESLDAYRHAFSNFTNKN